MSGDYREQLNATSLCLLAETVGAGGAFDHHDLSAGRPNDIRLALASPKATRLLSPDTAAPGLLRLAVAVHRTADDICTSGWTTRDQVSVDLPLVQFAGQGEHQHQIVDLLASFLPPESATQLPPVPSITKDAGLPDLPGTPGRLIRLIDLAGQVAETERAGALRLLGDEALFVAGMVPGRAAEHRLDPDVLERIDEVLPRAVRNLSADIRPQLRTVLDVYLMFGPVWYQMAAQNLLYFRMQRSLVAFASQFSSARRFLVRVAQGPLAPWLDPLFLPSGLAPV